jgi:hypothetical protein
VAYLQCVRQQTSVQSTALASAGSYVSNRSVQRVSALMPTTNHRAVLTWLPQVTGAAQREAITDG